MICGICEGEYQPTDADVDDAIAGITDHACPNCRRIVNMLRDEATRRARASGIEKFCTQCQTVTYYDDTEHLWCCECIAIAEIPDDELMPTLEHIPDYWIDLPGPLVPDPDDFGVD